MARPDQRSIGEAAWFTAIAAIAALQATLIWTHEPWLDEWQALLIAVESPDLEAMLETIRYEGHPPLWHLILRGIAAVTGPEHALATAVTLTAIVTQTAILTASGVPRALRLAIALSAPVLFEFGVISRGASFGVMALFLAARCWQSRWVWPLLALLPLTHFLFGVISALMVMILWREGRFWAPGAALWIGAGLAAAWTVLPPPDIQPALETASPKGEYIRWLARLGMLAFPLQLTWNVVFGIGLLLCPIFLAVAWAQTRSRPTDFLAVLGFIAVQGAFSAYVYPLAFRHVMLIAVLLAVLAFLPGRRISRAFAAWSGGLALCGLITAGIALTRPFDVSRQAAAEIRRLGIAEADWVSLPDYFAVPLSGHLGIAFERPGAGCRLTFMRWETRPGWETLEAAEAWIEERARRGDFYLISAVALRNHQPLVVVEGGYIGYSYHIYRFGEPGLPSALPFCVASLNRPDGERP